MGVKPEEQNTLKLYVSLDDEMWCLVGSGMPTPSGYSYDEFCKKPRFVNSTTHVRLIGSSRNAKLICKLFKLREEGGIASLSVCSPQVEKVHLDEYCPEKVLINMRKWLYPSSIGGFHTVGLDDFIVYSLSEALKDIKSLDDPMDETLALFKAHPLYGILKFIPFLNIKACALVASVIIDPRWYIDMSSPNKLANLYEYLGISSVKQPAYVVEMTDPDFQCHKLEKRNLVLRAWRNDINLEKDFSSNFLIKTYLKVRENFLPSKAKDNEITFDEADLATSQKFIAFIYGMWLDWLYKMPNPWNESLFVPEHFFSTEKEVERFKKFFNR
jgi:hypothetical protein